MVYAGHVLYDSARRFEAGDWVRTTQLVEFADECIFRRVLPHFHGRF